MGKRLGVGIIVIAVLAIGAGILANPSSGGSAAFGKGGPSNHAALGRAQGELFAAAVVLAGAPPRARHLPAQPAPQSRGRAVAVHPSSAAPHGAPARAMVKQKAVPRAPQVPVVDPATVLLPPSGPLLLLNPNTAAPGATISVLGSNFAPSMLVTLTLETPTTRHALFLDTAEAGRDGNFSKTVVLPSTVTSRTFRVMAWQPQGAPRLHLGAVSAEAHGSLSMGSPTATLSTAVGKPGDVVYTSARGFDPGEAVAVYLNNLGTAPVTTLHADGGGALSLTPVPVPYGPPGATSLLLLGRHSQGLAAVPFEMLSLYPTASVSSYAAVADTILSFTASGFGPDETVDVRVNTPDQFAVGQLRTDGGGTLRNEGGFRIPFSMHGKNSFVLTGERSHTSTIVTFSVLPYTPMAQPSSYGGGPGTAITFYGSGFARHETVRLWRGWPGQGGTQVATMTTDSHGNLVARPGLYFIGPDSRPGKLLFILAGDKSVTAVPVTFNVQAAGGPVDLGASATGGQ